MILSILAQVATYDQFQTTPVATINLSPWAVILQPIEQGVAIAAGTLITGLAAWAWAWVAKRLKIENLNMDAAHRASLDAAATTVAGTILNSLGNQLQGKVIDVKSPAVVAAVQQIQGLAPEAISYFGLDQLPDVLAQKIVAKLPQIANTAAPVVVQPR